MKIRKILPLCLLLWPLLAPAAVTLHYWTGNGANGLWSNPANWSGTVPTTANHRAIFPNSAAKRSVTNNYLGGITVESVWILGSGYNIANGSIRTDYLRADYPAGGTSTFRSALSTAADLQIIVDNNNSTLVIPGNLHLNNDTVVFSGNGDVTHQGIISGAGNLYKTNLGDLRLEGFGANTFSGTTFATAGILRLNRYFFTANFILKGTTAIPGNLYIGQGNGGPAGDIVVLDRDNQIADTSLVTVRGSGSLELSDEYDTIGALNLVAGTVTTGAGLLTLNGDVTVEAGTDPSIISGNLNLGSGAQRIFNIEANAELHVPATISGPANMTLVKTNRGHLYLTAPNTYSGDTLLQAGEMHLLGAGKPGNTVGGTRLAGGLLRMWSSVVEGEALTVQSVTSLASEGTQNQWTGDIAIHATLQVVNAPNSHLQLNGAISGTANMYKLGTGTLSLGGVTDNTHTGITSIQQGTLELAKPWVGQSLNAIAGSLAIGNGDLSPDLVLVKYLRSNQIADTCIVGLNKDATLNLNGWSDTVGRINMNGGTISTATGQLTVNSNVITSPSDIPAVINGNLELGDSPRTFMVEDGPANPDLILNTRITGGPNGSLIKSGPGKARITGDVGNAYAGPTIVMEGTLVLDKLPGLIAVPGELIIGDNFGGPNADVVELDGHEQIANAAHIRVDPSGLLDLRSSNETIGSLAGAGTVNLGGGTLHVGLNNGTTAYGGVIQGAGDLIKSGAGSFQLDGPQSYSGLTEIQRGELRVNGSLASALIEVKQDATLAGTGSVQSVHIQPGGILSPGPGIALFGIHGNLAMGKGTLLCDMAGSTCDQLQVAGTVDVSNAILQLNSATPATGKTDFTLINATGAAAVAGTFFDMPESHSWMHQGILLDISYTGGTGNDIVLTSAPPPPSEIHSIRKNAEGGMELVGRGLPGRQYNVEATSNLNPPANWTQIAILQADNNGLYQFVDQDAPLHAQRFYRVLSL